jgi:Protein of unknown function (DUF1573)
MSAGMNIRASLCTIGLILSCTAMAPRARADLRFAESQVDAGMVPTGSQLVHHFHFVNDGPEKIVITAVRTSCGCLAPKLSRKEYLPGDEGVLDLEVNTLTQSPGPRIWTAHVGYLLGMAAREQQVELRARMTAQVSVQPAALVVQAARAAQHKIVLTDRRPKHLSVVGVRTSFAGLRACLGKESFDGEGHWNVEILLAVDETIADGRYSADLLLYTDDEAFADLRVPVTIVSHARQRVSAVPEEVQLSAGPGVSPSRLVRLRDSRDEKVNIDSIDVGNPALVCTWAEGPGNQATVKIRISPNKHQGDTLESAVYIHLRSPLPLNVVVPVRIGSP